MVVSVAYREDFRYRLWRFPDAHGLRPARTEQTCQRSSGDAQAARWLAQVSSLPEIRVKESTREAALRGVERRLRAYFERVELVRLDLGETNDNRPLLEHFGSFADDPTFDDWQAEIAAYRQEPNRPPE